MVPTVPCRALRTHNRLPVGGAVESFNPRSTAALEGLALPAEQRARLAAAKAAFSAAADELWGDTGSGGR
jgi:hypothetical protein